MLNELPARPYALRVGTSLSTLLLFLIQVGCATLQGITETKTRIPESGYQAAFQSAIQRGELLGYNAVLNDPRNGRLVLVRGGGLSKRTRTIEVLFEPTGAGEREVKFTGQAKSAGTSRNPEVNILTQIFAAQTTPQLDADIAQITQAVEASSAAVQRSPLPRAPTPPPLPAPAPDPTTPPPPGPQPPAQSVPTPPEPPKQTKPPDLGPDRKDDRMPTAELQERLRDLGYKPGPVDGKMGKATIGALKKFQQDNNLAITGRPDSATVDRLRQTDTAAKPQPPNVPREPTVDTPPKVLPPTVKSPTDL